MVLVAIRLQFHAVLFIHQLLDFSNLAGFFDAVPLLLGICVFASEPPPIFYSTILLVVHIVVLSRSISPAYHYCPVPLCAIPVSYTHLDVYKRQV